MSDEKLINLNLKISRLTDIYLLKKPDLISLCTTKKLKNTGTVENLRSRLSKYYKGVVELDDIENTLTEKEKNTILTESLNNKIEINELLAEYDLAVDSSSESNNENTESPKLKLNKLKEINNELNNKANKLSTQADSILNTSNQLYQNIIDQNTNHNYNNINPGITINKKEHYYEDIELIKSNETQSNLNNTYFNKPHIINKSKMVNNNMIIKPDSFSGQGDIKLFFKQYEKAALINNWDNNDKITFLSIFLKDTAGTFLENLESIKAHWSWEELKN